MNDTVNQTEAKKFFSIVAVMAVYEREGQGKQRYLNVLAELDSVHITKKALSQIHISAVHRVTEENKISPEEIKDIVILGISPLGIMTKDEFYATNG